MTESSDHRPFLLALALLLALAGLSFTLNWPGSVVSKDAPAGEFSAERAVTTLEALLDVAGGTHPVGSAANARVHEGVVRQLEAAGWEVERQRGASCRRSRTCTAAENLIARRPGAGSGPAVLVACHTDSVPAAPGAGDDGAGMAVMLELARNLAAAPALDRPVWLLFDEGEEQGLLGAELFVREMAPEIEDGAIGAVVNLEARGTTGPVWMFETSDGGGELVRAYARSVRRPSTSSIAYSVYKRMPNDTDLTVFREAGLPGVGLAFIDGGARYHTPRDDLEHLSTASVQRMGESTLELVRELASSELPVAKSEAVFFDLASLFTITWPVALSAPAAIFGLLLVMVAAGRAFSAREMTTMELSRATTAWLLALFGAVAGGVAVHWLLDVAGALPTPFPANITWATAAAAAAGVLGAAGGATLIARRLAPLAQLLGGLATLGVLALAVSLLEPASSYPFVLACLGGGLVALRWPRAAGLLAAVLLLLTLAPLARMLPIGLGPVGLVGSAALAGLVAAPILPLLPRRPRLLPGLAVVVVLVVVTAFMPALTFDNPQAVSIHAQVLVEAHATDMEATDATTDAATDSAERSSRALLVASGELPAELLEAGGPATTVDYGRRGATAVAIEDPGAPPAEIRVLERGEDRMRLHLRSPRAAWSMILTLPEETHVTEVAWPGLEPVVLDEESSSIRLHAVPPEGVEVEIGGRLDVEIELVDRALGLPPEAEHLARARPEWAVPIRLGDLTEVLSRVDLAALEVETLAVETPEAGPTTQETTPAPDEGAAEQGADEESGI